MLLTLLLDACGARTALEVGDGGPVADAEEPVDAEEPECRLDIDCEDGLTCTLERCVAGRCERTLDDSLCEDGLFCTGPERCTPTGCVSAGRTCEDGVMCTEDRCDEALDACVADPRRERCPVSFRCDPERGCRASALVHDADTLLEVDLPSGDLSVIGELPFPFNDLALDPEGGLYGAWDGRLFAFEIDTGRATEVASIGGRFFALESAPGGLFYGASDDRISLLDPTLGSATVIGLFPPPYRSSGDLALIGERLYATGTDGDGSDLLFVLEPGVSREVVSLGSTGFGCIWGLAARGEILYGFTCEGLLIEISTESGLARMLRRLGPRFYGAAAR